MGRFLVVEALAELVFPARCVGCGRHGTLLCAACRAALPLLDQVCARCALRKNGSGNCRGCRRLAPSLRALRAVCAYEGAARAAVHAFKFRGGRSLAPLMGELLRQHLAVRPLHAELIVPVPLAPQRHKERGYNQAQLLAEQVVSTVGGVLVCDALRREDRPAQRTLTAADRLVNLAGAIRAQRRLDGRRILLIDDVATTGATLSACAEALSAAGACSVRALVFARDL